MIAGDPHQLDRGQSVNYFIGKAARDLTKAIATHPIFRFVTNKSFASFLLGKRSSDFSLFAKDASQNDRRTALTLVRCAVGQAGWMLDASLNVLLTEYPDPLYSDRNESGVPLYRLQCKNNLKWDDFERDAMAASVKRRLEKFAATHRVDEIAVMKHQIEIGREHMERYVSKRQRQRSNKKMSQKYFHESQFANLLSIFVLEGDNYDNDNNEMMNDSTLYGPTDPFEFANNFIKHITAKEEDLGILGHPGYSVILRDFLDGPFPCFNSGLSLNEMIKFFADSSDNPNFSHIWLMPSETFFYDNGNIIAHYNGQKFDMEPADDSFRSNGIDTLMIQAVTRLGVDLSREQCNASRKAGAISTLKDCHKVAKLRRKLKEFRDAFKKAVHPIRTRKKGVLKDIFQVRGTMRHYGQPLSSLSEHHKPAHLVVLYSLRSCSCRLLKVTLELAMTVFSTGIFATPTTCVERGLNFN